MVYEDLIPFYKWLPFALLGFIVICATLSFVGGIFGYLVASLRHGPTEGFYVVSRVFFSAIPDLMATSPRRIWAIARLAIRETVRRKVLLVAFALFALLILIGGWFLDTDSDNPERVYIGFLGWGTQLLVIVLGLMISTFSLPQDIKNKTIHTVLTKPVRATEIVFGRIVGFALVGTILLTTIWVVSYFFITSGLQHEHRVDVDSIQDVTSDRSVTGGRVSAGAIKEGFTTLNKRHRHHIEIFPESEETNGDRAEHGEYAVVNPEKGHTHPLSIGKGSDGKDVYELGPVEENLLARVPIYASDLSFISHEGDKVARGINPGNEWDYRSFVQGGASKAAAIFSFEGVRESDFEPGNIPLNIQVEIFRSYKGDIENRISASLDIHSIQGDYEYESVKPNHVDVFETQEYAVQTRYLPRKIVCLRKNLLDPSAPLESGTFDFFDDIAKNGKVDLILRCNNEKQYIGVAKKDVFFRPQNKGFFQNFLKAYLGIWLQMLVVVSLGVMFSTFLSSIVALLSTVSALVLGLQAGFLRELISDQAEGGGPVESFYRIITQKNMVNPLDEGAMSAIVKSVDIVALYVINSIAYAMPDWSKISFFQFLAEGYNIEGQRLLIGVVLTLSFCFVTTMIGYFFLKTREIAG